MDNIAKVRFKGAVAISLNNHDIPHLVGHKRNNLNRFEEAGISVNWQATEIPPGTFMLNSARNQVAGTIFDALAGF
jgi:hypothetical protein